MERQEIETSLKTSSYLTDEFWESIHSGIKPKTTPVPNYRQPTRGELYGQVDSEMQGIHMDMDGFLKSAANNMSPEELSVAMHDTHSPREDGETTFQGHPLPQTHSNRPKLTLSRNQAMAIKKYPTLVEFLGRPEGDKIAKEINGHMNAAMSDLIHSNSKQANEYAMACRADKQNLREYFQGDGWVCRVTASGPFRGDEAIYYSHDKDLACVLRKSDVSGQVRYADVSSQFNLIYETGEGTVPPVLVEETTVEASVEETTSAEQGENHEVIEQDQEMVSQEASS
ncbi:MAG: hypothetical protein ACXAC5_01230 [Promethearchaeota archaeon]